LFVSYGHLVPRFVYKLAHDKCRSCLMFAV
jgi:hypothetical protein